MKSNQNNVASLKVDKGVRQNFRRKPHFTPFRRDKMEFFLYESQSSEKFRHHFGSVGTSKWIEYFIKFLNAPRVDAKVVSVWLQKFLKLKGLDLSTLEANFAAGTGRDSNSNDYPRKWYTALKKLKLKETMTTESTLTSDSQNDFSADSSMLKKANMQNNSGENNSVHYEAAVEKFHIEQSSKLDSISKNQVFRTLSMMEEPWISHHESNFHQNTNMITNHAAANTNETVIQYPQTVYPSIGENSGIIDYSDSNEKNNSAVEGIPLLRNGLFSVSQNNFLTTDNGFKGWKKKWVTEQNAVEPNSFQFQTIDHLAVNSEGNESQEMMSYESDINPIVLSQPEYNLLPTVANPSSNLPWPYNLVSNVAAQGKSKPFYEEDKNNNIMEITNTGADISTFAVGVDGEMKKPIKVNKDHTPGGGSSTLDVVDKELEAEETCADFAVNLVKHVDDSKCGVCKIYIDILKSICVGNRKAIRIITELENCICRH